MKSKIGLRSSMMLRILHQEFHISCYALVKRYGHKFAERSIYRHAKKPMDEAEAFDRRHNNKGRPRKLSLRDERCIVRSLNALRRERTEFTSGKIQEWAGINHAVGNRTVRRCLRKHGYRYRQSRKKGLLTAKDLAMRLRYARQQISKKPKNFWTQGICFYLDGVGFAHKTNPCGEARATSSMTWRKPSEGLRVTTKGKKEGSGGRMANFFVGISFSKGVVLCEHHKWKIDGKNFSNFIKEHFPATFEKVGAVPGERRFLQDGCPRQNAIVAQKTWTRLGYEVVRIPARSPDLNPIENFFHLVRKKLQADADKNNIKRESYDDFVARIRRTMLSFSGQVIANLIGSMPKRLAAVVKSKGCRTKY